MCTGRVLVYGGQNTNRTALASVEMLTLDGKGWQTLPTPMFTASDYLLSVPMPD